MKTFEGKIITAILPAGAGIPLIKHLKSRKGILAANSNHSRGTGSLAVKGSRGVGRQQEKDIVNVLVETDQSDALFEYIFRVAHINRPHGGFIFMSSTPRMTHFTLPENLKNET